MMAAPQLQNLEHLLIWDTYVAALYWAMSTMSTVGYGDVVPHQTAERIWCMFGMLIGVTAFAYFMSSVSSIAAAVNSYSNRMAAQRAELDEFLRAARVRACHHKGGEAGGWGEALPSHPPGARQIPKELANKVRRYRHYVMEREYSHSAYDIIEVSPVLWLGFGLRKRLRMWRGSQNSAPRPFASAASCAFLPHKGEHGMRASRMHSIESTAMPSTSRAEGEGGGGSPSAPPPQRRWLDILVLACLRP